MAAFVVDASAVVRLLGIGTQDERFALVTADRRLRRAAHQLTQVPVLP